LLQDFAASTLRTNVTTNKPFFAQTEIGLPSISHLHTVSPP
jgi:hypothetical protein